MTCEKVKCIIPWLSANCYTWYIQMFTLHHYCGQPSILAMLLNRAAIAVLYRHMYELY